MIDRSPRPRRPSLRSHPPGVSQRSQPSAKSYVPALDGMRAFAVLAVMVGHLGGRNVLFAGGLGVDVFFVLSGFLITSLIIGERTRRGSFSFGNFYARRALRLLPALFAAIVLAWLICTFDAGQPWVHQTIHNLVWVVFYGANWVRAGGHDIGLLGQTWSLSVEEQFYLVWPAVTLALLAWSRRSKRRSKRRSHRHSLRHSTGERNLARCAAILGWAAAAVALYRVAVLQVGWNPFRVSNGTDTHCDGLLVGAALAFWIASGARLPARRVVSAAVVVGTVGLLAFMELAHDAVLVEEAGYVVAALATAAMVASEVGYGGGPLHRVLSVPAARWVGRRSYALYLFHFPIFIVVGVGPGRYGHWVLATALSFAAAVASQVLVESPALRLKRRFERTEAGLAAPSAA